MQKSLEKRLNSLEERLAELEGGKNTSTMTKVERLFCDIGVAHMLFHVGDTLLHDPNSDRFDKFLQDMFGGVAKPEMRRAYAAKLFERGTELLKKAEKEYRNK